MRHLHGDMIFSIKKRYKLELCLYTGMKTCNVCGEKQRSDYEGERCWGCTQKAVNKCWKEYLKQHPEIDGKQDNNDMRARRYGL